MRVLRKALWVILIVALGYGILLLAERLTVQELTRATHPSTQETVCLVWKPSLLKGKGVCDLELLSPQGKVLDATRLATLEAGFEALQQFGQLEFEEQDILVSSRRTGELVRRVPVRDGRFDPAN